jgi:hypothetical protein
VRRCRACGFTLNPDDATACGLCDSAALDPPVAEGAAAPPPPAYYLPAQPTDDDPWLAHFGRYLLVSLCLGVSFYVLVGFLWMGHVLRRTGYRARDLLWLVVPVWGTVVSIRALWRYTARQPYWSPRPDRPSAVLAGSQRTAALVGGVVAIPALVVVSVVSIAVLGRQARDTYWTSPVVDSYVTALTHQGLTEAQARCVMGEIEVRYPKGVDGVPPAELAGAGRQAAINCR